MQQTNNSEHYAIQIVIFSEWKYYIYFLYYISFAKKKCCTKKYMFDKENTKLPTLITANMLDAYI